VLVTFRPVWLKVRYVTTENQLTSKRLDAYSRVVLRRKILFIGD
jgi:hypothetical protein